MKYLLLLFILLFSTISYSQFIPTLDEDHSWNVIYWSFWSGGYTNINNFSLLGEETINDKTYKIIYRDNVETSCRLREENGIIYSYEENINDEKIMIDLNLEVGAVLNEDYYCFGGGGGTIWEYHVVEVATEFIADADRKVITLEGFDITGESFGYFEKWIEGIGSTNGLAPFGYNYDFYNMMTCFTENENVSYFNGFNTCEPPILSIESYSKSEIILFPNPITNNSILQFPQEAKIDQIKIYTISGKLIKNEVITTENITLKNVDFSSGLYFYQVFSENKLVKSDKFLVK